MTGAGEKRSGLATVAFVDLAGFSALTDVYGDDVAVDVIEHFECLVDRTVGDEAMPVKWIGDEAMFAFPDPRTAVGRLAELLGACRAERWMPLTRTGMHHGPVIHRRGDVFGATVNVASRLTALARPGEVLSTELPATAAMALGHRVQSAGPIGVRSLAMPVDVHVLDLTEPTRPGAIDPVCKMHAPASASSVSGAKQWFCSQRCERAYAAAPDTYR